MMRSIVAIHSILPLPLLRVPARNSYPTTGVLFIIFPPTRRLLNRFPLFPFSQDCFWSLLLWDGTRSSFARFPFVGFATNTAQYAWPSLYRRVHLKHAVICWPRTPLGVIGSAANETPRLPYPEFYIWVHCGRVYFPFEGPGEVAILGRSDAMRVGATVVYSDSSGKRVSSGSLSSMAGGYEVPTDLISTRTFARSVLE